jgi:arginase
VPITLGGDHHITNPLVRAVAAHAQQPISIVQFDAHNDLYEDYEGDPYSHASPFARILERGPQECAKLVQLGIRTATTHNRAQVKKKNWHFFWLFIRQIGVYHSLDCCMHVYAAARDNVCA